MEILKAVYQLASDEADVRARAEALAVEQSVEMPASAIRSEFARRETLGRVGAIERVGERDFRVTLHLAAATTGHECGQLMNMLFGNCSIQEDVRLVDVELPDSLLEAFPGPRFGVGALRARLGVAARALTCTALKPQGLSPDELGALAGVFARAGIDVIKDDHGIADQRYSPFAARVRACQRALDAAMRETGRRVLYAPSLSGSPKALHEQVRIAADAGVEMLLATPMIMGLPTFHELVSESIRVPIMAHPAFSGALRIDPPLFYGKLFRLLGADAVVFPNYGGRFSYSRATCEALATTALGPLGAHAPAMPVPAGGMTVERVPELLAVYGRDVMLLIGGGLLSAGDALFERSRQFVDMVAAGAARAA
jgi:ribulose-bisphosphate carboxylase large chain